MQQFFEKMLQVNWGSTDSTHSSPNSTLQGAPESGVVSPNGRNNMSPRPSYHFDSVLQLETTFPDQSTFLYRESDQKAPGFCSIASLSSNVTPTTKSSAELMKEIALLESEIIHMERVLLSLYRTAFEQKLPPLLENKGTYIQDNTGSALEVLADQSCYKIKPDMCKAGLTSHPQTSPGLAGSDSPSFATPTKTSSDQKNAHCSLAQHLGASCIVEAVNSPDRISEEIVRCISSIYCKLANPTSPHTGFSVSSTSSMSSSSTFSPRNLSDSWSPQFNGEATTHGQLHELREESRPYAAMIEVLKICLDNDGFNFAARMLQKFRSLVKSLEEVDPGKMKREEKLAFWINIHNALVMHAYLAYGTHTHVRSTSILKAAYNVGGQCISAYIIQNSILGIRSHYSQPWLQTLLSPGKKFKMGSSPHVYAIEYPEALVHFALSSGASSDPPVRVYTAKNVFRDLKLAKDEFIRATVHIHKETKIFLPKILDYFAKDMSLDVPGLLEVVNGCLFEEQHNTITKCLKGRHDKYVHWLPHSSTFRYMFHRQLAERITSG